MADNNRANKRLLVHNSVIEVSQSTKKKPGYVKIAIPDELAENIMKGKLGYWCSDNSPKIMALELHWIENTVDDNKKKS